MLGSGPLPSDQMKGCSRKSRFMFRVLERQPADGQVVKVAQMSGLCDRSTYALAGSQRAASSAMPLRRRKRIFKEARKVGALI